MKDVLLINIDLGTSGVKVEVYDERGKLLAEGKAPIHKQTTSEWVRALKEATPTSFLTSSKGRKIVTADSTSGTFILVDEYGNPLADPVMYYEKSLHGYNLVKDLESVRELSELGVHVDAASPISKLVELREKGLLERARWVIPPTQWVLYKLVYSEKQKWTSVEVDYTNALKFGANITREPPEWYKPVFEETKIPLEKMPRIVGCGEYMGIAESKFARELGLEGAEVYQGVTDGNAAALASGALKEGDLSIYGGTTVVPKYVSSTIKQHPAVYYHKHPLKGYLAGAATSFTGGFLSWFAEKLLGMTVDELVKYTEQLDDYSGVPLFMPPGDRSPFNDPFLKAALLGLYPWDEPREKILGKLGLAVMLGITFLEYSYVDLFEKLFGKRVSEVRLTGGTVKSRLWNELRAAIYERPVKIYGERVGVGALIPAVLKSGLFKDIEEVERVFLAPQGAYTPNPQLTSVFKKDRDLFVARWRGLQKVYRETSVESLA